ncbi:MAG: hypothetical protein J0L73_14425 [Verrucomicrobia bacterium]|nr:hypothetical protein [Verrucomicrobiota bacterium]
MSDPSLSKKLRESLSKAGHFVSRAILITPQKVEGTVIFDQKDGQSVNRGDFIPSQPNVVIAENERCQLLLGKSNVVLNVRISRGRSRALEEEHFRFEVVVWESMA